MIFNVRPLVALLLLLSFSIAGGLLVTESRAEVSVATISQDIDSKGVYQFSNWHGPAINIHYYRPPGLSKDAPVIIVMHGTKRDADRYRDEWQSLADSGRFIVIAPEFTKQDFPRAKHYNMGLPVSNGKRAFRSFDVIEPIFDDVKSRLNSSQKGYYLFGHSAGSQFVHRFVFFKPDARILKAFSANAGWYTLPTREMDYPYGLDKTDVPAANIAAAFAKNMVIMLGTADVDPNHENLRKTTEAMQQGQHRLARGQTFFQIAQTEAEAMNVPFNWQMHLVQGVGHNNGGMAPAVLQFLEREF